MTALVKLHHSVCKSSALKSFVKLNITDMNQMCNIMKLFFCFLGRLCRSLTDHQRGSKPDIIYRIYAKNCAEKRFPLCEIATGNLNTMLFL